ncbi:hypothetical protein ACUHMQ_12315 [Chitinimonas sp. PSY-7]|uniref:hypothetical protein n=1 Tax=Chitinimonas sp. PSY-7 TaxID=3459088 RepID=UPI004040091B
MRCWKGEIGHGVLSGSYIDRDNSPSGGVDGWLGVFVLLTRVGEPVVGHAMPE